MPDRQHRSRVSAGHMHGRLLAPQRVQQPGDRGHQPGQRRPVHQVGTAEVVHRFATGLPVTGCRSSSASCRYDTTVPSLFRRRASRRYTPTGQAVSAGQSKRYPQVVCLRQSLGRRREKPMPSQDPIDQAPILPTNCGSPAGSKGRNCRSAPIWQMSSRPRTPGNDPSASDGSCVSSAAPPIGLTRA